MSAELYSPHNRNAMKQIKIEMDHSDVYRIISPDNLAKRNEEFWEHEMMSQALNPIKNAVQPAYAYKVMNGSIDGDTLLLHPGEGRDPVCLHIGNRYAEMLRGCTRFAVYACTLGESYASALSTMNVRQRFGELDSRVFNLAKETGRAYLLRTRQEMQTSCLAPREGAASTRPFIPGLKEWDNTLQKYWPIEWDESDRSLLLSLFAPDECDVTLDKQNHLCPQGSECGIFGIIKK